MKILIQLGLLIACADGLQDCTRTRCSYPGQNSLRFFVLGDTGGNNSGYPLPEQFAVAQSMRRDSNLTPPWFFLTTGDNIYSYGVESVNDPRFYTTFEQVYKNVQPGAPWYMIAGNHDYYGNVSAQIDYSNKNPRWVYPSLYYAVRYAFGRKSEMVTVDIFMIDTIQMCGDDSYLNSKEGFRFNKQLNTWITNVPLDKEKWQLKWLSQQLRSSKASHIFVVGHHPIYSTGKHYYYFCGPNSKPPPPPRPCSCVAPALAELLIKNKVTAYFSGHNHMLEYSTMSSAKGGWTVHLITTGAGSKVDEWWNNDLLTLAPKRSSTMKATNLFLYPNPRGKIKTNGGAYVYVEMDARGVMFNLRRGDGISMWRTAKSGRRDRG